MASQVVGACCVLVLIVAGVAGCKGKTEVRADPQVAKDLEICRSEGTDKATLITSLEGQLADLKRAGGGGGGAGIVVTLEGGILGVNSKAAGIGASRIDNKTAMAMSRQFINLVTKSRGQIQKCYQQVLKTNTSLQARAVSLQLKASFAPSGDFESTSSSPSLGETFDACLSGIAAKWKMPAASESMTFQAPLSLKPS